MNSKRGAAAMNVLSEMNEDVFAPDWAHNWIVGVPSKSILGWMDQEPYNRSTPEPRVMEE